MTGFLTMHKNFCLECNVQLGSSSAPMEYYRENEFDERGYFIANYCGICLPGAVMKIIERNNSCIWSGPEWRIMTRSTYKIVKTFEEEFPFRSIVDCDFALSAKFKSFKHAFDGLKILQSGLDHMWHQRGFPTHWKEA